MDGPVLVSRAQIAGYAGVSRAAVTNWRKRGPDFPEPADVEGELLDLDQVIDWLSSRAIPANARQPHEPAGTTYADRVRANTGTRGTGELLPSAASDDGAEDDEKTAREAKRLLWHTLGRLRGYIFPAESCYLLLDLLYIRAELTETWRELLRHAELRSGPDALPETVSLWSRVALGALGAEDLYRTVTDITLIGSGDEGREKLATAFDVLLSVLEEDRSAGILRTPDSLVEAIVGLFVTDAAPSSMSTIRFAELGSS